MKKIAAAVAMAVIATTSQSADKKVAALEHQVTAACNAEATKRELAGPGRNRFVASCVADGKKRQGEVMKACTEAAEYKKTSERKDFMAECTRR